MLTIASVVCSILRKTDKHSVFNTICPYLIVVNRSRFEEDHNLWKVKNKRKVSSNRDKSEETVTRTATIQADQNNKHEPTLSRACETNTVDDQTAEAINCSPRNDSLTGSQVREKFFMEHSVLQCSQKF